jgi:hypothetical protein
METDRAGSRHKDSHGTEAGLIANSGGTGYRMATYYGGMGGTCLNSPVVATASEIRRTSVRSPTWRSGLFHHPSRSRCCHNEDHRDLSRCIGIGQSYCLGIPNEYRTRSRNTKRRALRSRTASTSSEGFVVRFFARSSAVLNPSSRSIAPA